MRLSFYTVDSEYCDYLRAYDKHVPFTMASKASRPFLGIIFKIDNHSYYAPLSSPKIKHLKMKNQIDFIKINNGQWGVINLNNMIPVVDISTHKIDFSNLNYNNADAYKELLQNQLSWCNSNREFIINKAQKLYNIVTNPKETTSKQLLNRCCNFAKLEKVLDKYISKHNTPTPDYAYAKIESEQVKDLQLAQIDFEARLADDGKIIVRYNAGDKDRVEQLLAAPPSSGLKLK